MTGSLADHHPSELAWSSTVCLSIVMDPTIGTLTSFCVCLSSVAVDDAVVVRLCRERRKNLRP